MEPMAKRGRSKAWTNVPVNEAERVVYSGRLDFFNGKEVPVGFRDAQVVFFCADGIVINKPDDVEAGWTRLPGDRVDWSPPVAWGLLHAINLPPRQWMIKEIKGRIEDPEELRILASWQRLEFVAHRQRRGLWGRRTFRRVIATKAASFDPSNPYLYVSGPDTKPMLRYPR